MLIHPNFNPVVIQIGNFGLHWYGITYVVAFLLFLRLGQHALKNHVFMDKALLEKTLNYGVFGVILGGRLGYVLFYKPAFFLLNPLKIVAIWEGGMSFHGGLLGVGVALGLLAYQTKNSFWGIADFVAPLTPLGLAAGRIGNFINGELWGKVTNAPWGMLFPKAYLADKLYAQTHLEWIECFSKYQALPRHPSQIYECCLEGIFLFIIMHLYSQKPRKTAQISGIFLLCYGLIRFSVEWTREPDFFMPELWLNLSMGQWLSLPMILIGGLLSLYPLKQKLIPSQLR